MIVGVGEDGKTSIVRTLQSQQPNTTQDGIESRTIAIDICDWNPIEGNPLNMSFWDFGGQEDYFPYHQVYLTEGSLFILTVDLSEYNETSFDQNETVYEWMDALMSRVPDCDMIIVGSKIDKLRSEEEEKERKMEGLKHHANHFLKEKKRKEKKKKKKKNNNKKKALLFTHEH